MLQKARIMLQKALTVAHRRKNRRDIHLRREHTYRCLRITLQTIAHRRKNRRSTVPRKIIIHIHPRVRPIRPRARPIHPRALPIHPRVRPIHPRARPIHPRVRPIRPRARPIRHKKRNKNFTVPQIIIINRKNNN